MKQINNQVKSVADIDRLENLSDFWAAVRKYIIVKVPERKICLKWGMRILRAWKDAPKFDKENHGVKRREEIENEIIMDLFFNAVFIRRPYGLRFLWVSEAFAEEPKPSKKMRTMFFRCTMPVVWRNLEVVNEDVRFAASSIVLHFYPLLSDDEFEREEYLKKQHEIMAQMLMDNCVPIRVMALKKLPLHFCNYWKNFPKELVKSCLEKMVDKLSLDAMPEVRAAVYEGIGHLLPSPDALNANQHSLEILTKRGVNDKTEKVRLAAFRMLNRLHGHRYIKLLDLIEMKDIILRLDFEHSHSIKNQIVKLIFKPFVPQEVEGIDYMERFKRIYFMCKISSNASLSFHHLIYPLGLLPIGIAVHHIKCLLLGVKAVLKSISGDENDDDDSTDTLRLDSSDSTLADEQQKNDNKLNLSKDVLDSAIVLWMAVRYDLFCTKNAQHNTDLANLMANMLETLNQFKNHTGLMESSLVIARHLPKHQIGRLFGQVKEKLLSADTKQPHFPHYVEALAAWDLNLLIEIIEKGLKKFRNELIAVTDPSKQMSTPRRRQANSFRDSPPTKRVRVNDYFDENMRPLELIQILLSCPLTSEELQKDFTIHLEGFFESLNTIRKQFGNLLVMPEWEKKFSSQLLFAAYETFTIVALITKRLEEPNRRSCSQDSLPEVERTLPVNDRLLYTEMKWFANILSERMPSFQVIKMFLRCMSLHLTSGELTNVVLNEVANMLMEIRGIIEDQYDASSVELALRKCAQHLKEALEGSQDLDLAQRTISLKVTPLLESLEETQDEDLGGGGGDDARENAFS